jgi:hypothetical protein
MTPSFDMRRLHHGCGESLWGGPLESFSLPDAQRIQATSRYQRFAPRTLETGPGANAPSAGRSAE